jgi:hypothetical protein
MRAPEQGYAAHGWKQGPNHGPRPGVEAGIEARLAELSGRDRRKVVLSGQCPCPCIHRIHWSSCLDRDRTRLGSDHAVMRRERRRKQLLTVKRLTN